MTEIHDQDHFPRKHKSQESVRADLVRDIMLLLNVVSEMYTKEPHIHVERIHLRREKFSELSA